MTQPTQSAIQIALSELVYASDCWKGGKSCDIPQQHIDTIRTVLEQALLPKMDILECSSCFGIYHIPGVTECDCQVGAKPTYNKWVCFKISAPRESV